MSIKTTDGRLDWLRYVEALVLIGGVLAWWVIFAGQFLTMKGDLETLKLQHMKGIHLVAEARVNNIESLHIKLEALHVRDIALVNRKLDILIDRSGNQ